MLPDRVSNPAPLSYESGALLIALRSPALKEREADSFNQELTSIINNCHQNMVITPRK